MTLPMMCFRYPEVVNPLSSYLGLAFCLQVGLQFSHRLSQQWDVPLVLVNHLEAHSLVPFCHG